MRKLSDEERASQFWSRLESMPNGCRLWPNGNSNGGYGKTGWRGKPLMAHQLAFFLTHGWRPKGREVIIRHTCDEPRCCEPTHLVIGTQKDNARDRQERNRRAQPPSWTTHNAAIKSPDVIREIRARHAAGESYTKLGFEYGLHPQNIGRICRREGYRDVT